MQRFYEASLKEVTTLFLGMTIGLLLHVWRYYFALSLMAQLIMIYEIIFNIIDRGLFND